MIEFCYVTDRTAELMFEKYKVPALFMAKNAVCILSFSSPFFQLLERELLAQSVIFLAFAIH